VSLTAEIDGPAELVRGRAVVLALPLLGADLATVTPSAWTATLSRLGEEVATGSGSGAVAWTVTAGAALALADDYLIDWLVTVAGRQYPLRQDAVVCVAPLYPVVTPSDLYAHLPRLRPDAVEPMLDQATRDDDIAAAIKAAWQGITGYLRGQGSRPHLIVDAHALRPWHTAAALAILTGGAAASMGSDLFAQMSMRFEERADAHRKSLQVRFAAPEAAPTSLPRRSASSTLWLGGSPPGAYGYPAPSRGR
jgi:hypothetical protein